MDSKIMTVTGTDEVLSQVEKDVEAFDENDFRHNPTLFIEEILGCPMWWRQKEIVESVWKYKQTYVHSANSVGKTWLAGRVALAWMLCHLNPDKQEDVLVIIIGAKYETLRRQTWAHLGAAFNNSLFPLGGLCQATIYHPLASRPGSYVGIFGTDKDNPENIAGFHAAHMLFIVEEASKLDSDTLKAIEGCTTGSNNHILLIGNPIRTEGTFFNRCTDPKNKKLKELGIRNVICVSAGEVPNVVLDKEIYPGMATRSWIKEQEEEYGIESPFYQARVLGKFPTIGEDQIIPLEAINAACTEDRLQSIRIDESKRILALDIARQGADLSCIIGLSGNYVEFLEGRRITDTTVTRDWFKQVIKDWDSKTDVAIDENGLGGGPYDELRKENIPVRGWVSQWKAHDEGRFANLKSEVLWSLRKRFIEGFIAIPDSKFRDKLCNDLMSYRYEFDNKGRIKSVDPTSKSPDFGDALVIAHWMQNGGKISVEFEATAKAPEDRVALGDLTKISSSVVNREF